MALEQLSLAPAPVDGGGDEGMRAPRLPRWTRQEILVLIQGKRVAENRVRRGRTAGLAFGPGQVEPKWASVSSYCKRHGVNRGPVQCRKRWSNLAGDYKKIKEWESQIREETESFWVMRNDLRREKKLPGFFDREVYDILDGGVVVVGGVGGGGSSSSTPTPVLALALAPSSTTTVVAEEEDDDDVKQGTGDEAEGVVVFDSGRSAAAEDGLFSDFEQQQSTGQFDDDDDDENENEVGGSPTPHKKELQQQQQPPPKKEPPTTTLPPVAPPLPFSEKQDEPPFTQGGASQGASREKPHPSNPDTLTAQEVRKRKRFATEGDEEANLQHKLIKALENNGRLLSSHLEAQNTNFQLDREQRKDHVNSLVEVLNKLADAFVKIADKL